MLKSLSAGFIPLLAYIAADLLFGETIGLFIGLGIGILEFFVSLLREKKADLFIAADTLLLAAMGALSLILRNQIFFRLKPAILEGVMALAMGFLLVMPQETLKSYMSHQVKGLVLEDRSLPVLRRSLLMVAAVLLIHMGLTIWAALVASTALWGFVSGGLLYILLGFALVGQWLANRGKEARPGGRKKDASPATPWSLLVFDESGRVYAEKVALSNEVRLDPGAVSAITEFWDCPIKGAANGKEELEDSLGRAFARLGITIPSAAGAGFPLAIHPIFIMDSEGRMKSPHAAQEQTSLGSIRAALEPGSELVLAATIPLSAFPKGVDPTSRRFWPLADLEALAAMGRLSPAFTATVLALASLRHPLRGAEGASIVNGIHDAAV
ncbi:MAG: septation protein IspZ [Spirochaetales bacterium]